MTARADGEYLLYDPFEGDESVITCRTREIRTVRKNHICYGLSGKRDHKITNGERYWYERARIDDSFFGEYRICLRCMDKFIDGEF